MALEKNGVSLDLAFGMWWLFIGAARATNKI